MIKLRKSFQNIALLFDLGSKVNRDRLSGILRRASAIENWEIRTYTANDLDRTLGTPASARNTLWMPDGIILVDTDSRYADFCRFCERQSRRHIPCVVIDGNPSNRKRKPAGEVFTDDKEIGRCAANYFLKQKFANFAFVATCDETERWHSDLRQSAYAGVLKAAGCPCQTIEMLRQSDGRTLTIPEIAAQLKTLQSPCAVFAYSDEIARTILDACRYASLTVPECLSVLGVDDQTEITENTRPTLSSILPDFEESGYRAAEMLASILRNDQTAKRRICSTKILHISERASTQDVRGGGRIVRIATEYIRLHLSEPVHTRDIARAINLSPRLLEMRFREVLGVTVREKITELRLQKACHLMRGTKMSIAQIACSCGYATPDGFRLALRKTLGVSPGEWLRNNRTDRDADDA